MLRLAAMFLPIIKRNKVACEVLKCLFDYAFDNLKVDRITAVTDADNIPCIRLMERLGMKRDENSVKRLWFNGKWGSEFTYTVRKPVNPDINPAGNT